MTRLRGDSFWTRFGVFNGKFKKNTVVKNEPSQLKIKYVLQEFSEENKEVIFRISNTSVVSIQAGVLLKDKNIYIYTFSRCFYPKRLTVHSGYTFVLSVCVPWESNPQPLRC